MSKDTFASYRVEAWDTLQHLFKVKKINNYTLHFAADFSEKLDLNRLKRAVDLTADAFPLIRCGLNENSRRPRWKDKGFTANDMVKLITAENKDESVSQFLCKDADAVNGPQLKVGLIRVGDADTLCVTMNHMLCDAAGFKDYLYMLGSVYTRIGDNPSYRPASAMENRKISQVLKTFSIRDRLKIMSMKNDMSTHDKATFEFEGNLDNPFIETRTIKREQFCLLKSYAKAHSSTVNDVMLAAYIRVLFELFGHSVALPCTLDLRKYLPGRRAGGICNLVTNLNCSIGSSVGAQFEETLKKVKQVMDSQKADISCIKSIALLEKVLDILPYKKAISIIEKSFTNPPIAFTNIGILDKERLVFGEAAMTSAYMTGSIKYNPYFQLAISTFDNEAVLSINFFGTQSDRNKISLFLDKFIEELQYAM